MINLLERLNTGRKERSVLRGSFLLRNLLPLFGSVIATVQNVQAGFVR